jgi:hypothetical protein
MYLCPKYFLSFTTTFCFTNLDYRLIRVTPPQLLLIIEGLLYVYIDVLHASAWTVGRIVFVFGI